ncbi:DUF4468 domain-containing protein [Mucilaginibacter sp. UR6-11]|uniref:DUF4468 domain-containing protein n=1 Tax=Mucilaginibacter sp. UR6-11 TaxID=1435644 RepID=UPI001E4748A7|nr:DUF4468 domain-containing protein [Mucilaginibacter sp. UR6-11]
MGLNTPFINGQVVYQKVFNAPGRPAAVLYSYAELWFVKRFKNFNNIQIQDEVIARVVGNGTDILTFKGGLLGMELTYHVTMTIQIDSRDGRYRARVSNVVIEIEDANKLKTL